MGALWGPLRKKSGMKEKAMEWAFDLGDGWMLDPSVEKGSLVQFCSCPGPNEAAAVVSCHQARGRDNKHGAWVFATKERLPKDWQVTMQYGDNSKGSEQFFEERGIQR